MHGVKAFDKLGVFVSPYKTVYNVATLKSFMNHIAALGYNALYLDISGGFEIEDEPMFCYLRARYSGASSGRKSMVLLRGDLAIGVPPFRFFQFTTSGPDCKLARGRFL